MEPEVTPLALSAREAARALAISERTLWAATQPRGPIPSVRLGNRVLYPITGLQEWLTRASTEAIVGGENEAEE